MALLRFETGEITRPVFDVNAALLSAGDHVVRAYVNADTVMARITMLD